MFLISCNIKNYLEFLLFGIFKKSIVKQLNLLKILFGIFSPPIGGME